MNDFRATVERLCEKRVQSIPIDDLEKQLFDVVFRQYSIPIKPVKWSEHHLSFIVDRYFRYTEDPAMTFDELAGFLSTEAQKRGWFVLSKDSKTHTISFTANYTDKGEVPQSRNMSGDRVAGTLWHVAPASISNMIRTKGLRPRSGYNTDLSKDKQDQATPPRVYLFTNSTDAKESGEMFTHSRKQKFILWKVDTTKINKGVNYYSDPEYESAFEPVSPAVWTYSHIPAEALTMAGAINA